MRFKNSIWPVLNNQERYILSKYRLYVIDCFSCKSLELVMDKTQQDKKEPIHWELATSDHYWSNTEICRGQSCKVNCNQQPDDSQCELLSRSKKSPHYEWSIRKDEGQVLHMQETIPCICYGMLLLKEQVLELAQASFMISSDASRKQKYLEMLARNICQGLLEICV